MMKIMLGFIVVMAMVALVTGIGMIPAIIGSMTMMVFAVIQLVLFSVLARGPAMEFIKTRLHGGMVLTVVRRDRQAAFGRVQAQAGMVKTKHHGAFNLMPEAIYSAGGISWAIAPEKVGYVVKPEHGQIAEEMKKRGVGSITEISDTDEFGRVTNLKDTKEVKDEIEVKPQMTTFDDMYKYCAEAANPIHQDTNIYLGIKQGLIGKVGEGWGKWIVLGGLGFLFAALGAYILLQGGSGKTIEIIIDNAKHVITA